MHVRKDLGCLEETISRNVDIKGDCGKGSEREKSSREIYCLGEYIYNGDQNVGRNVNVTVCSGEISEMGNIIGHWRKGHPCHQVTKNLAELCFSVLGKVELVNTELGYFTISKQSAEGRAWFPWNHLTVRCGRKE